MRHYPETINLSEQKKNLEIIESSQLQENLDEIIFAMQVDIYFEAFSSKEWASFGVKCSCLVAWGQ